jgi:hypothetical protein
VAEGGVETACPILNRGFGFIFVLYLRADPAAGDGRAFTAAKMGGKDPGTLPSSVEVPVGSLVFFFLNDSFFISIC